MPAFRTARAGIAALALFGGLVAPAAAQEAVEAKRVPTISVVGRASLSVAPDAVLLTVGVATQRPRAREAAADNARAAQKLMDAAKAQDIAPKDIQTDSIGLEPVYDTPPKGSPHLTGYRSSLSLHVRVKPVDKAGALISALTDAGANGIDGIEFVVSPDAARDDQLHAEAARDARHQAEIYAGGLGVKLGRVLLIAPGGSMEPQGALVLRKAAVPAPAVPISAGEELQEAQVSVTFEIVQ